MSDEKRRNLSGLRAKAERQFEIIAGWLFRNRYKTLAVMGTIIFLLGSQVKNLSIDTSTEEMLHRSDPSRIEYNRFKEQFGNSEYSIIVIESKEIFTREFLTRLKQLHSELKKKVPYLFRVTSLINARNTRAEGDTLIVDDLLKDWPEKEYDLKKIREIVLNNSFYLNDIISDDGLATAIIVENQAGLTDEKTGDNFLEDFGDSDFSEMQNSEKAAGDDVKMLPALAPHQNAEIRKTISGIIEEYQSPGFKIAYTGGSVIINAFNVETDKNMKKFTLLTIVAVILFLYIIFRRVSGILLPGIIVLSSTGSTLGIMVLCGTAISLMTTVIPAFLMAVGIADSIHVLAVFYRRFQEGKTKEEAVCYAVGHSGVAILMTSVTTSAGLLSFSMAEIATIADMGIYASVGVLLALAYTIILLPALISIAPLRHKPARKEKRKSARMDNTLLFFARFGVKHPVKIVTVSFLLTMVSFYYISELRFKNNILEYFSDSYPAKVDLKEIEKKLQGALSVEVVIDTGMENGVHDPEILNSIENLSEKILKIKNEDLYVGKIISIVDIVKESNQALHGNNPAYYTIPQDKRTVSQVLFMFEASGSDDLEEITDNQFRKTRVTIKTKWADSIVYDNFVNNLEKMFQKEFGNRAEITVTGLAALLARTIPAAMSSMVESYLIAFVVITVFMLVLVGDIKLGLLSMIPNMLPIVIVMGMIRMCGFHLDITSLFIGSIAIGLVVDDTIHFMYNFRKFYSRTGDFNKSIEATFLGTGRALLITSVVLTANFFILISGSLINSRIFGFFTGIVIILALLADFILAPALLRLAIGKNKQTVCKSAEIGTTEPVQGKRAV